MTGSRPRTTGSGRHAISRRGDRAVRRARESELTLTVGLAALSILFGWAVWAFEAASMSLLLVPIVIGSLFLGPRRLPALIVVIFLVMAAVIGLDQLRHEPQQSTRWVAVASVSAVGIVSLFVSRRRNRLGVASLRGESMLVDLRERISKQGLLPALPPDWYAEAVVRSAEGSAFAGDFMVAGTSRDHRHLNVAVVDVSGKGVRAGTRSLLLSGAFGGLLGALPPERFLPAANGYLIQQEWSEGFASAVHLRLDLHTGAFELRSAGHPPAVRLHAGSGRWSVLQAEGPVLGLIDDADFEPLTGRLLPGDALLLYTDGLVETPARDIGLGIDRLTGQAERLLRGGFQDGARKLIDRLESRHDDRLLLLLHRR